ncbi:YhfC family intramembrane metalloprotease [Clostridium ganghwense]|uniref:YhfC family glutamic-type intramembrane protease n=1 Tax=Clostridium ganghwense TaxID=312089 RepID=A0ABT4CLW2_9CLOT|nr:YhfC family glutamic-type intramembrane protease [Clostridium ganghwense]MCY6370042.1 YhfC family glutamic-type intramembrane protease [Clostridium ganghwense]
MVNNISIMFMIISFMICFGLPIGLTIYFYKKKKVSLLAVGVGALIFIVSQISTRLPLIGYLNTKSWFIQNIKSNTIIYVLFLALTAGIFEEVGRFIGFKYLLKNKLSWKNGIAFGIGHGGIEAILLVGITYVSNIILSILINIGNFDALVAQKSPQIAGIKNILIGTPSYMFFIGGIERIFTIIFHIALTVIVLEGVMKKENKYLLYAILIHALVDFVAGYNINIFVTEGFMFVTAIVSFRFLIKSKKRFNDIEV